MKSPIPSEFKDPENTAFALIADDKKFGDLGHKLEVKPITGTDGIPVFSSVAVTELGESGLKTKNYQSEGVASDTLFSADSMTKMITAATVLRMTEEEKYQQFLPKGIDTKLSDLLPLLKKHYPNSTYINPTKLTDIQAGLESQPDFANITLQHLAHHTSGLQTAFKYSYPNQKLTPDAMLDVEKAPRTGKWGEKIGEYLYNNIGYELLGRIVVAIANEASASEQKGEAKIRKYGDVVEELVISRVREKVDVEEKKEPSDVRLDFFTSDQMEIVDGKTRVIGHPELRIQFGKHYHDGQFREVPSHSYDLASGGSYATAESMSKIAFHILHDDAKFSVFKTQKTLDVFNSQQVPQFNKDGTPHAQQKTYGFGYESYEGYQRYRTHGGGGFGSNSNSFVDTKENKVAVVMVGFENLTLPLAYALINKEKATAPVRLSPELYKKSLELSKNYSESQLVEMRQGLEKSYEEFKEKLETFQKQRTDALDLQHPKKPSPSPEKIYAEKMVGISKSGAHEI
jgi:CubicO group peptidase (beta-lactamase class C family)